MKQRLFAALALLSTAAYADMRIDAATRTRVVTNLANKIGTTYVLPEQADALKTQLLQHLQSGSYDNFDKAEAFAEALSEEMQVVDKHFVLRYMERTLEPDDPPAAILNPARYDAKQAMQFLEPALTRGKQDNFGFHDYKRLDGNIAYLRISSFYAPSLSNLTIQFEMSRVSDAAALIIDLRNNGGGDADAVAAVSAYLFDGQPVHLGDRYMREVNRTESLWTVPPASDLRFGGSKPVYILVNKQTFSAAEAFAFLLQKLKRATIVGETTRGGSHRTRGYTIDQHFLAGIPFATTTSAVTHDDWEGKGVQADVPSSSDSALDTALALAQKPANTKDAGK